MLPVFFTLMTTPTLCSPRGQTLPAMKWGFWHGGKGRDLCLGETGVTHSHPIPTGILLADQAPALSGAVGLRGPLRHPG